jgi:hypothetical protein
MHFRNANLACGLLVRVVLLEAAAVGCGVGNTADGTHPRLDGIVSTVAASSLHQGPRSRESPASPLRFGLRAAIVLRPNHPLAEPAASTCTFSQIARLRVEEVRADSDRLYLDVKHSGPQLAEDRAPESEVPDVTVRVDRCRDVRPIPTGRVQPNGPFAGTIALSLNELPDGELDFVIRAFGSEEYLTLRKVGIEVTYLALEDRDGFETVPAYPELGLPAAAGLREPDCRNHAGSTVRGEK